MDCIEKFRNKMDLSGGSLRNERLRDSKKIINQLFNDDITYAPNIYFWKLNLKDYSKETPINIRLYGRKLSTANGSYINFQTEYDTPIYIGDIIYEKDNDTFWICEESFDISKTHWRGKLYECNWILRWQNSKGEIIEYPCKDMNTTQYNSGETSTLHITYKSSQHRLTLPCDENTIYIKSPQRFYLDKNKIQPLSYIVTQNDTTSYNFGKKGIVKITVMEYPNDNKNDRPDIGICDYFDPKMVNIQGTYHINIDYENLIIKSGGDLQTFIGKFYDDKNNLIDTELKWAVICDFIDKLHITQEGNSLSISLDDDRYIDEDIKIICSDMTNTYSSTLFLRTDSLL